MTPDLNLADGIKWYLVFLFSTTAHEAAHAWTALKLGDDTAHRGGQVTLDPTPHIKREPLGMVVIPLVTFFANHWMIGWASAPYNVQWALQHPRRSALMSLAGPASNFLLMLLSGILIRMGVALHFFEAPPAVEFALVTVPVAGGGLMLFCAKMLSILFSLNLLLGAFNLLPLPPLDGSGVLFFLATPSTAESFFRFLRNPAFSLFGLVIAWKYFYVVFTPLQVFVLNHLYPGAHYSLN